MHRLDAWRRTNLALTLLLASGLALGAFGQSPADPPNTSSDDSSQDVSLTYELDVARLLDVSQTLPSDVQDGIWRVTPSAEKRLLVLPLHITPSTVPMSFGPTAIRARAGRLLAYLVPAPEDSDDASTLRGGDTTDAQTRFPRLTRSLTVTPHGRVQWKLDRFIPGGAIADPAQLYALKIQPTLAEAPNNADNRGPRSPQDRQARQQELEAQRARAREQAELRKRILALPTEFDEPLPPVVLAVIEVRTNNPDADLSGSEPLPWRLSLDDLQPLAAGSDEALERLDQVLAADPSPYGLRLAARALVRTPLLDQPQVRPSVAALAKRVLAGSDAQARLVVITVLASAPTPAPESLELLRQAAKDADGLNRLTALAGLLRLAGSDVAAVDHVLAGFASTWAMPSPPPADQVIDALLARPLGESEQINAKLIDAVDWPKIPAARRQPAIRKVIDRAPDTSLARRWLDAKLLGASDPALIKQTLTILADAAKDQPPSTGPATARRIIFSRNEMAMLKHLESRDPALRDLAWTGLTCFRIPSSESDDPNEEPGPEVELMVKIAQLATALTPTPPSALPFVLDQPGRHTRAAGLVRLTLGADPTTAAAAAKAMLGSNLPLAAALVRLDPPSRRKLADRVYTALTGNAPLVTPLLIEPKGVHAVCDWWAAQLAAGRLPGPELWVKPFDGTQKMLSTASMANDPAVRAAVASALAAAAGGDAAAQQALIQDFDKVQDSRLTDLMDIWHARRHQILIKQIAAQARTYRFTLVRPEPPARLDLGLARLEVREQNPVLSVGNVSLAIPPDTEELVVRLTNPAELANFAVKGIETWELDQVPQIDLTLQPDGAWLGSFTAPSGSAELRLEPQNLR
ncbi:MAG: hypothetical protein IT442_06340 [Phycisphaeraceae bacterium]|nr:hypothetical protein [Phycisphaeraceae bacterium]